MKYSVKNVISALHTDEKIQNALKSAVATALTGDGWTSELPSPYVTIMFSNSNNA